MYIGLVSERREQLNYEMSIHLISFIYIFYLYLLFSNENDPNYIKLNFLTFDDNQITIVVIYIVLIFAISAIVF